MDDINEKLGVVVTSLSYSVIVGVVILVLSLGHVIMTMLILMTSFGTQSFQYHRSLNKGICSFFQYVNVVFTISGIIFFSILLVLCMYYFAIFNNFVGGLISSSVVGFFLFVWLVSFLFQVFFYVHSTNSKIAVFNEKQYETFLKKHRDIFPNDPGHFDVHCFHFGEDERKITTLQRKYFVNISSWSDPTEDNIDRTYDQDWIFVNIDTENHLHKIRIDDMKEFLHNKHEDNDQYCKVQFHPPKPIIFEYDTIILRTGSNTHISERPSFSFSFFVLRSVFVKNDNFLSKVLSLCFCTNIFRFLVYTFGELESKTQTQLFLKLAEEGCLESPSNVYSPPASSSSSSAYCSSSSSTLQFENLKNHHRRNRNTIGGRRKTKRQRNRTSSSSNNTNGTTSRKRTTSEKKRRQKRREQFRKQYFLDEMDGIYDEESYHNSSSHDSSDMSGLSSSDESFSLAVGMATSGTSLEDDDSNLVESDISD